MLFDYVAWFRNDALPPSDQGYEWPACFHIEAPSSEAAQAWGDHLARSYAVRVPEMIFLGSDLEPTTDETQPVIHVGEEASDAKIGW